jgi:hypothetical protein
MRTIGITNTKTTPLYNSGGIADRGVELILIRPTPFLQSETDLIPTGWGQVKQFSIPLLSTVSEMNLKVKLN